MDLVMPRLDGVGGDARAARGGCPRARVIVLTSFPDDDKLLPAVQAGAAGYLLKNVEPQELARAVRAAHAGEALLDPAVAARLVDALADAGRRAASSALTPREREVLEPDRPRLPEQAHRARAGHRREDGQDARRPRARQARRRPTARRRRCYAVRAGPGRAEVLRTNASGVCDPRGVGRSTPPLPAAGSRAQVEPTRTSAT